MRAVAWLLAVSAGCAPSGDPQTAEASNAGDPQDGAAAALDADASASTAVTVEGRYSSGFEVSSLLPCGSNEAWWVGGTAYAELAARVRALYGPGDLYAAQMFIRVRGELSPPGTFGHMGAYVRELSVTEVVEVLPLGAGCEPAAPAMCESAAQTSKAPWAASAGLVLGGGGAELAATPDGELTALGSFSPQEVAQPARYELRRYAADGTLLWNQRLGSEDSSVPAAWPALAAHPDCTVTVAGGWYGEGHFGVGDASQTLQAPGTRRLFVGRWTRAGELLWLASSEPAGSDVSEARVHATSAASTAGDTVTVAGVYRGAHTLGGSAAYTLPDLYDGLFAASWSPGGTVSWARSLGQLAADTRPIVSVGPGGTAVVAARLLIVGGSADQRLLWLDLVGNVARDTSVCPPNGGLAVTALAPYGDNAIVAAGAFSGAVGCDWPSTHWTAAGRVDTFDDYSTAWTGAWAAAFEQDGQILWARYWTSPAHLRTAAVAVAAQGALLLAGSAEGTVEIGATVTTGEADALLIRDPMDGTGATATVFGGAGDEALTALASWPAGALALAGYYEEGLEAPFLKAPLLSSGVVEAFVAVP